MTDRQLDSEVVDQMTDALAHGHKIRAIKLYREATGEGLKEAKDFVDALIPQLVEQDPERFASLNRQGTGCGAAVILLLTVVCLGFALVA